MLGPPSRFPGSETLPVAGCSLYMTKSTGAEGILILGCYAKGPRSCRMRNIELNCKHSTALYCTVLYCTEVRWTGLNPLWSGCWRGQGQLQLLAAFQTLTQFWPCKSGSVGGVGRTSARDEAHLKIRDLFIPTSAIRSESLRPLCWSGPVPWLARFRSRNKRRNWAHHLHVTRSPGRAIWCCKGKLPIASLSRVCLPSSVPILQVLSPQTDPCEFGSTDLDRTWPAQEREPKTTSVV